MLDFVQIPSNRFVRPQNEFADRESTDDASGLFARAINSPLDFPALKKFIFPGDRVAIALLEGLQQPIEAIRAIVLILRNEISDLEISIVVSPVHQNLVEELTQLVDSQLKERTGENSTRPVLQLHDPLDKNSVACIATSKSGEAVYINRTLFDADVVIPVSSFAVHELESGSSVYPEFSFESTRAKFHEQAESLTELRSEIRLAEAHLGADFGVMVLAGPGGDISAVYAGHRSSIYAKASRIAEDSWSVEQQAEGQVVIATIEANSDHQTWEQFLQAVASASAASNNVQQIVICSEIRELPDSRYRKILNLQFESDYDLINRQLESATELHQSIPSILESVSVYLKSHLNQNDVEELGLGFVESDEEIQRIVDRAESGILLRDAHLCRITQRVSSQ